jgi:hypothetical protein
MTMYVKGVNRGTAQINNGNNPYYMLIGVGPNYAVLYEHTTAKPVLQFTAGAGSSVATSAGTNPSAGDSVELIATLSATGVADVAQSLNGGTITTDTGAGSACAFPSAWTQPVLTLGAGDVGNGYFEYQVARVAAGVQTWATMRQG